MQIATRSTCRLDRQAKPTDWRLPPTTPVQNLSDRLQVMDPCQAFHPDCFLEWNPEKGSYCGWHGKLFVRWYLQGNHHSREILDGAGFRPTVAPCWTTSTCASEDVQDTYFELEGQGESRVLVVYLAKAWGLAGGQ